MAIVASVSVADAAWWLRYQVYSSRSWRARSCSRRSRNVAGFVVAAIADVELESAAAGGGVVVVVVASSSSCYSYCCYYYCYYYCCYYYYNYDYYFC